MRYIAIRAFQISAVLSQEEDAAQLALLLETASSSIDSYIAAVNLDLSYIDIYQAATIKEQLHSVTKYLTKIPASSPLHLAASAVQRRFDAIKTYQSSHCNQLAQVIAREAALKDEVQQLKVELTAAKSALLPILPAPVKSEAVVELEKRNLVADRRLAAFAKEVSQKNEKIFALSSKANQVDSLRQRLQVSEASLSEKTALEKDNAVLRERLAHLEATSSCAVIEQNLAQTPPSSIPLPLQVKQLQDLITKERNHAASLSTTHTVSIENLRQQFQAELERRQTEMQSSSTALEQEYADSADRAQQEADTLRAHFSAQFTAIQQRADKLQLQNANSAARERQLLETLALRQREFDAALKAKNDQLVRARTRKAHAATTSIDDDPDR